MTQQPASPSTAQHIFDAAPLGALIRFSDGTPRPPDRFKNKLRAWKSNNGVARLVCKRPASEKFPATFRLHNGDFGANGVVVMRTYTHLSVTDTRRFEIESVPPAGSVLILTDEDHPELEHVAADMAEAERWKAENYASRVNLQIVTGQDLPPCS